MRQNKFVLMGFADSCVGKTGAGWHLYILTVMTSTYLIFIARYTKQDLKPSFYVLLEHLICPTSPTQIKNTKHNVMYKILKLNR